MERENKGSVERERQDRQHQLEVYFRDMEEKYAKERIIEQKRHEEIVGDLESKCQLEWRAKVLDMEHLLEKEKVIAQRKEQVLLRLIEFGRIAKMETLRRTGTKMGKDWLSVLNTVKQVKEEYHNTERHKHSKSNMREQVEKAERRIENEQQKEIQWKQQRSQEMAEKLKEMLQQFETDKKRIEEKWMEMEKKSEEDRAESRQELEKQKDQGEHREKNKDTVVRPRRRGNEDRKTDDDEGKLLGVSEQEAKREFSMRNKGIDFLYELKQDVVKGKRESLVDEEGPKEGCIMTSRRVERRGRTLERKELERREQLGDWLQDIDIKTERESVMEQKTEEPLKTKNDSKQSTMNNFKREWQVSLKTVDEENYKTEGIATMSRRREDSKTGAINQVKKEELMKALFKEKKQKTAEERWHEPTEKRQRGMAENPQETANESKHEPQMFRQRQKELVTQEDEQKNQILRLGKQNPKQDIKTEECCQTSPKIERWTRGWMQTEKNDAKHGTINEREDEALWVTRGSREEDRQANTGDVAGAKAGRRSTGTCRQQEGLKDDDMDAQVCRLWKSTNQTAFEDTPLCSDYRPAMCVQQMAAINATTQENTVPGTEAEHKTDRNAKTLQVSRQREKECKKETTITTKRNIEPKVNAWIDTRDKKELKSEDVMDTKVFNGRERHQRKKIIQEENAWQRELEMKLSETEEKKPRDKATQKRQRLLKPQKQIEEQEIEKEKERDSFQIEKQKELRQQKKVERGKEIERQKEQHKQLQTEKLKVLESHRDTNREKEANKLKVRHKQSVKDLEQPEMAANIRRRRNAGPRVALCWQSNSNEKPKRDAVATTPVERKDEPVVNLKEQVPQHSNNHPQAQSLASDPSDKEEETGGATPSAAGEGAQQEISGAAEKSEETAEGEAVKKDKSMRRRFLGWANKKAKDYYNNKIEKTMKREQEEGDQVYQSCKISMVFLLLYLQMHGGFTVNKVSNTFMSKLFQQIR
ncbi:hypothetical protein ACEWY4_019084 [Coilia grayii]|uniref:Trichohyalin-like n=1 Tax=Coilia grayii TaxID=363190 RepID=A0ABD1JG84_9TELE